MKNFIIFSSLILLLFITSGCGIKEENTNMDKILNNSKELIEAKTGLEREIPKDAEVELDFKNPAESSIEPQIQREIKLENLASTYDKAVIKTNFGDIKVKLYSEGSPLTVNNFMNLAKKGFYDGTKFHRVIKDFMIQGGDPNSKDDDWSNDGMGGPGYQFQDEFNTHKLVRGSLAMANSGANTNGSQFFIVTANTTPWLDGKHTNFGEVIEGMEIIDKIENVKTNSQDHPLEDVAVEKVELIGN